MNARNAVVGFVGALALAAAIVALQLAVNAALGAL